VPIHPAPHDSIHAIHSGKVSPIPSHLCRRKA
jgi:hypothetical protein